MTVPLNNFFDQAQANRELVTQLPDERFDWQITTLFYECVHHLNVVFRIYKTIIPIDHVKRFELLRSQPVYKLVRRPYENLFSLSIISRYEAYPISDLQEDRGKAQQYAEQIRNFCRPILKIEGLDIP